MENDILEDILKIARKIRRSCSSTCGACMHAQDKLLAINKVKKEHATLLEDYVVNYRLKNK